jgi:hypothetical protein
MGARKDSLAEENSRSRVEMLALCSLTSTYFDTSKPRKLEIAFDEYPVFYEPPKVTTADLLPVDTQTWPRLQSLSMRYMPLNLADAQRFVEILKGGLEVLDCYCLYLVHGSWVDVLDTFRGLKSLKSFTILYPKGGECGERDRYKFPQEEFAEYVLKTRAKNPLPDFFKKPEENRRIHV